MRDPPAFRCPGTQRCHPRCSNPASPRVPSGVPVPVPTPEPQPRCGAGPAAPGGGGWGGSAPRPGPQPAPAGPFPGLQQPPGIPCAPLYRWGAAVPGRSSSGVPERSLCARVLPPVPPCSLLSEGRARSQKSSANCAGERQFCKVTVVQGDTHTHTHKPVPRVAVRSSAVPRGLGTSAGPPCAAGSAVQHPPGLRVSWAGAAAGCHPLRDVTLSRMSPSLGCHPLRDATRSGMPPSAGCHPLQGAARLPPLAPLQQPNFSPRARAPAARAPRCCCRYFPPVHAARRPAGVVSCLLHYSSLAQRLGRAAAGCWGCWGPLRVAGVLASVALRCLWPEGVGGKLSGSPGCGAGGVWGAEGGDAPKVIEPGSGSGTSPVLLRDSTIP